MQAPTAAPLPLQPSTNQGLVAAYYLMGIIFLLPFWALHMMGYAFQGFGLALHDKIIGKPFQV